MEILGTNKKGVRSSMAKTDDDLENDRNE